MAFNNPTAYQWTEASILASAPRSTGVYGIFNQRWIYVGRGDIQTRLLAHFRGDNPCITRNVPTGFTFDVCAEAVSTAREKALIVELNPACNQRLG